MGCDGGTIPRRDELVRTKKKPEQKDKDSVLAFKWKHCAISQEALVKPVVACELGRLYNKETVLEFLLDKSKFEVAAQFDHIRGLKDIKELNLTDNPERRPNGAEKGDAFIDTSKSDFICPVVGLEMSGKYRFSFIWTCGCVMSERALREVKSEVCHKCGKSYKEEDVILLNGSEEEVTDLRSKMEERRALAKAAKKSKKSGKHKLANSEASEASTSGLGKKPRSDAQSSSSSSPHSESPSPPTDASSNGTADRKSKSSVGPSKHSIGKGASSKLLTNGKSAEERKSGKSKTGGTIQTDPRATKTFKSLFTTCEAEKLQQKPHWITYNPMYY
ncbi:replication termination factor 2 [Aplysia californica]|uniref:Replication termination factor 2 n=1 Tax=Aplysia californica TaxID=6500 RepID=A0ABM0JBW9_APLCA|nr:replication termination factor 2 [Aplysia californica]